jgi:hypothetical protein
VGLEGPVVAPCGEQEEVCDEVGVGACQDQAAADVSQLWHDHWTAVFVVWERVWPQSAETVHLAIAVWEARGLQFLEARECEVFAEIGVVEACASLRGFWDLNGESAADVLSQSACEEGQLAKDSAETASEVRIVLERVFTCFQREEVGWRWVDSCAQVLNGRAGLC